MAKANPKKDKTKHRSSADFMIASGNDVPFNYVESFKSLRTNLNFIAATEKINTLVLTSAIPGEGKSNTAINLAITLAEDNKSVVVVDCDLRKPSLNRGRRPEERVRLRHPRHPAGLRRHGCRHPRPLCRRCHPLCPLELRSEGNGPARERASDRRRCPPSRCRAHRLRREERYEELCLLLHL